MSYHMWIKFFKACEWLGLYKPSPEVLEAERRVSVLEQRIKEINAETDLLRKLIYLNTKRVNNEK